jgi:hypothetical protein
MRSSGSAPGGPVSNGMQITMTDVQGRAHTEHIMKNVAHETPPAVVDGTLVYTQLLTEGQSAGYLHAYSRPEGEAWLDIRLPHESAVNTRGAVPYRCSRER